MASYPWKQLELAGPADERSIKRAYARLAKLTRPDTDPQGFQALRAAYETALAHAQYAADEEEGTEEKGNAHDVKTIAQTSQQASAIDLNTDIYSTYYRHKDNNIYALTYIYNNEYKELNSVNEQSESVAAALKLLQTQHDSFEATQREWTALKELLASAVQSASSQAPDAEALQTHIAQLIAHPANIHLDTAQATEEFLIDQAANAEHWPTAALQLVWEHYHLDERLAFTKAWSIEHRIRQRLEASAEWQRVSEMIRRDPTVPEALLFRPLSRLDVWRYKASPTMHHRCREFLQWVRTHQPQQIASLNAESVETLDTLNAALIDQPQFGVAGLGFIVACVAFVSPHMWDAGVSALHWPLLSMAALMMVSGWSCYYLALALKKFLAPQVRRLSEQSPRALALSELVASFAVMMGFSIGCAYPAWGLALALPAAAFMFSSWSVHGRLRGVVSVNWKEALSLGFVVFLWLMLQVTLAYKPFWVIAPLAAVASFIRFLPLPPFELDEANKRYQWRHGETFKVPFLAVQGFVLAALFSVAALTVGLGPSYETVWWSSLGLVMLYSAWALVGWLPLWTLTEIPGIAGGFAFMFALGLLIAAFGVLKESGVNQLGAAHLVVATMLLIQTLIVTWRVLRKRSDGDEPASWWRQWLQRKQNEKQQKALANAAEGKAESKVPGLLIWLGAIVLFRFASEMLKQFN